MPSLEYLTFTARERTPTAKVYITHKGHIWDVSGNVSRDAGAISISGRQLGTPYAGATVRMVGTLPFTPLIKDIIEIQLGYNGQVRTRFIGVIINPSTTAYPYSWSIQASDILWIADFAVQESRGGVVLYDSAGEAIAAQLGGIVLDGPGGTPNFVPANDALERLLRDWAGIPEFRIILPLLETVVGQPWILGTLSPVVWSGVSPLQACLEIADVMGYWLFCDEAGFIRMRKISGAPPATVDFVLEEGVNVLSKAAPSIGRDSSSIYNQVIVTGANTLIVGEQALPVQDTRSANLPDLLPAGKYRQFSYANRLIEYVTIAQAGQASCEAIATRLMAEHSRNPATIQGTIKGNPFLQVGQGIGYKGPRLGYTTQRNFFLYGYSETFGGGVYEQSITLDGGTGSAGYTTTPPPDAAFTSQLLAETLANEGAVVEVFCDASSSISSLGAQAITAYTWLAPAGTPPSGTGARWMTRVPATETNVVITLTVTDATGKTSTPYSKTIPLAAGGSQPAVRVLNVAAETWYITPDAGKTWRTAPAAAKAVPPISAGGQAGIGENDLTHGLLATGDAQGGSIRRTLDRLATAPTTVIDTGANQIRFIWQHEREPARIWIALGNAVYLSIDGGATFGPARTPPVDSAEVDKTARWVVESADRLGVIDVLAGNAAFTSFDAGVTWVTALEGPAGSEALCYASGHGKHWVGLSVASGSPLRSFEGNNVVFVDASPPVLEIRAVTLLVDEPVMYAFDLQGRIWRMNADDGANAVQVALVPSTPNHAIRDGEFRVIYIAADNGIWKFFPDTNEILLLKALTAPDAGRMIGYAGFAAEDPPPVDPAPVPEPVPPPDVRSKSGRGLALYLGQTGGTPPAGWHTVAFVESGWTAPGSIFGAGTMPPGSTVTSRVWPSSPRNTGGWAWDGEEALFRHTFTLGADPVSNASLLIFADERIVKAYLNGTEIANNLKGYTGATPKAGVYLTIPLASSLFLQGKNVLALYIKNIDLNISGQNDMVNVAYNLTFAGGTGGTPPAGGAGATPTDPVPGSGIDQKHPTLTFRHITNANAGQPDVGTWWGWCEPGKVKVAFSKAPGSALAPTVTTIGDNGGDGNYFNLGLTHDQTTLHAAWINGGTSIRYRRYTGSAWSAETTIAAGLTGFANGIDLSHDRANIQRLLCTWRDADGVVYAMRSGDNGVTWAAPVAVNASVTKSYGGVPALADTSADHIAYGGDNGLIYLAQASGVNWTVTQVSNNVGDYFNPGLSVTPLGRVCIAYRNTGEFGVYYALREVGGSFVQREVISNLGAARVPKPVGTVGVAIFDQIATVGIAFVATINNESRALLTYGAPTTPGIWSTWATIFTNVRFRTNLIMNPHYYASGPTYGVEIVSENFATVNAKAEVDADGIQ